MQVQQHGPTTTRRGPKKQRKKKPSQADDGGDVEEEKVQGRYLYPSINVPSALPSAQNSNSGK